LLLISAGERLDSAGARGFLAGDPQAAQRSRDPSFSGFGAKIPVIQQFYGVWATILVQCT